jgi:hypothetical protein
MKLEYAKISLSSWSSTPWSLKLARPGASTWRALVLIFWRALPAKDTSAHEIIGGHFVAHKCRKASKFGVFLRNGLGFRVYEQRG